MALRLLTNLVLKPLEMVFPYVSVPDGFFIVVIVVVCLIGWFGFITEASILPF